MAHRADLVHWVPHDDDFPEDEEIDFCGYAAYPPFEESPPADRLGWGVSLVYCGSSTFAHELGHNHGVGHDRYLWQNWCDGLDETPADCFPTIENRFSPPYAWGYINPAGVAGGSSVDAWRTVMSYPDQCSDREPSVYCVPLLRFSNPRQRWFGDPLGVFGDVERQPYGSPAEAVRRGPADAARTHREMAHYLANRTVRRTPDLVVRAPRAEAPFLEPGAVVRLSAVVENLGVSTGPRAGVTLGRRRWRAPNWVSESPRSASVARIDAGARRVVSLSFELPSSPGPPYVYVLCASNAPGETLTSNNCSESVDLGGPDSGGFPLSLDFSITRYPLTERQSTYLLADVTNLSSFSYAAGAGLEWWVLRGTYERLARLGLGTFAPREEKRFKYPGVREYPVATDMKAFGACVFPSSLNRSPDPADYQDASEYCRFRSVEVLPRREIAVSVSAVPSAGRPGSLFRLGAEVVNNTGSTFSTGCSVTVIRRFTPASGGASADVRLWELTQSFDAACPRLQPGGVSRLAADIAMPDDVGTYSYIVRVTGGPSWTGVGSADISVSGAARFPLVLELVGVPATVREFSDLRYGVVVWNLAPVVFDGPVNLDLWWFTDTPRRSSYDLRNFRASGSRNFDHLTYYSVSEGSTLTGIGVCLYPTTLPRTPDPRFSPNWCEYRSITVVER